MPVCGRRSAEGGHEAAHRHAVRRRALHGRHIEVHRRWAATGGGEASMSGGRAADAHGFELLFEEFWMRLSTH